MKVSLPNWRKAKRYTPPQRNVLTDAYKAYVKETGSNISLDEWKAFFDCQTTVLMDELAVNSEGVMLPANMGIVMLAYTQTTRAKPSVVVDTNAYSKTGKLIPHLNFHTKGKIGKIIWSPKIPITKNTKLRIFAFNAAKKNKTRASIAFRNSPQLFKTYIPQS